MAAAADLVRWPMRNGEPHPSAATTCILVIDDEEVNLRLLRLLLRRQGFENVHTVQDARYAVSCFQTVEPDLVILDLHMPHLSGYEVLESIRERVEPGDYLPVLVLTGDTDPHSRHQALDAGANDFLNKPFDVTELRCRVRNLLDTRQLHVRLAGENERLELMVSERTRDLDASQEHLLDCLAYAADCRDDDTREHTHRVGDLAAALAAELGRPSYECEMIRRAARLHDVGKIAVPDAILLKPGSLTEAEYETMKRHTIVGANMFVGGRTPMIRLAGQIARSHHERWDGRGYPDGLAGEKIPLAARVAAVADVFDALSHARPYRDAWPDPQVHDEIFGNSGTHYDPDVVAALGRLLLRGDESLRRGEPEREIPAAPVVDGHLTTAHTFESSR